ARQERVRRAHPARERAARTDARGHGQVSRAVPSARRIAAADAHLAPRDSDRWRARRRDGDRVGVRRVAVDEPAAQAVRQRRAGVHPRRRAARVLPSLAEPARSHRARQPLRAGGLARRDRPRHRRLPPSLAGLVRWGAPKWPPIPPNARKRPGETVALLVQAARGGAGSARTRRYRTMRSRASPTVVATPLAPPPPSDSSTTRRMAPVMNADSCAVSAPRDASRRTRARTGSRASSYTSAVGCSLTYCASTARAPSSSPFNSR